MPDLPDKVTEEAVKALSVTVSREQLVDRIAALLTLEDTPWDETGVTERLWCRDRAARILDALDTSGEDDTGKVSAGKLGEPEGDASGEGFAGLPYHRQPSSVSKFPDGGAGTGNSPGGDCSAVPAPDRQGGEGPVDEEGPGLSPESLPAELIDQVMIEWFGDARELWTDDARERAQRAAPLLVEHGRQQEKARWETRIQAEISRRESIIDAMNVQFSQEHAAGRFSIAQAKLRSGDRERGHVRLLRSLLNEEEA